MGVPTDLCSQKPLPLETPTAIELSPGNRIRVTLLDANHCPGSVMFRMLTSVNFVPRL